MRIGSLFAGIGGLELGLEWAGLGTVVWQVEQDAWCREVLAKHWPSAQRFDDVRTVGAHNLPAVDVLCGGFPCQDISLAGKGAGLAGARSGLWSEFARIIGELRPRLVVVENVAVLRTRGLDRVLADLTACGYGAIWFPIRASDVGAPHRRERLFIVAWRVGQADSDRQGQPQSKGRECDQRGRTEHSGELADSDGARLEGRRLQECARLGERSARQSGASGCSEGSVESGVGREPTRLSAGLDGRWPAGRGQRQHDWEAPRTVEKCPQRTRRLKALGNAVVPQVAYVAGLVACDILRAQVE